MVGDVHFGSPAWKAGLGFGEKLIAVNGRDYSGDLLYDAIVEAQHSHRPITLLVEKDDMFRTIGIPYYNGPRYPHLVRVKGVPDHLMEVVKPLRKE
jgi:predicted metalloprotease with PDZ domain